MWLSCAKKITSTRGAYSVTHHLPLKCAPRVARTLDLDLALSNYLKIRPARSCIPSSPALDSLSLSTLAHRATPDLPRTRLWGCGIEPSRSALVPTSATRSHAHAHAHAIIRTHPHMLELGKLPSPPPSLSDANSHRRLASWQVSVTTPYQRRHAPHEPPRKGQRRERRHTHT